MTEGGALEGSLPPRSRRGRYRGGTDATPQGIAAPTRGRRVSARAPVAIACR